MTKGAFSANEMIFEQWNQAMAEAKAELFRPSGDVQRALALSTWAGEMRLAFGAMFPSKPMNLEPTAEMACLLPAGTMGARLERAPPEWELALAAESIRNPAGVSRAIDGRDVLGRLSSPVVRKVIEEALLCYIRGCLLSLDDAMKIAVKAGACPSVLGVLWTRVSCPLPVGEDVDVCLRRVLKEHATARLMELRREAATTTDPERMRDIGMEATQLHRELASLTPAWREDA